ncbi:MAG: 4Fe-4S dicluster domain-containing protein [Terriglobia bacterium]|jgi:Na+-translocating ferredoxin:NAD+ oxidoreductase RnfC subunit
MATLSEKLKACGVVGAGGAGFPTYVKAASKVEYVIANGAECEPLLHKDAELMAHSPAEILSGMKLMMSATGAQRGKFGVKQKNAEAIEAIQAQLGDAAIDLVMLGDFYPSGDEFELVPAATGRLVPPGGIPLQVGCVVSNVETLYNVHQAERGVPVTQKFLTVCGAVREPKSFWAAIGTRFRDLLPLAGGAAREPFGIFVSGIMMGTLSFDLDDVVTKTTSGLIILPRDHYLISRKERPLAAMHRIGRSACDQCSYCTEFCPRYLLGYEVMPHKVMRSLAFSLSGAKLWNQSAELCCACGLCTLYACPEDLYPKEACDQAKRDMRAEGIKFVQKKEVEIHPMKEGRRVPLSMLRKRLKIEEYERDAPYADVDLQPRSVKLKLAGLPGAPARPVVSAGQRVKAGELVASVRDQELGANVHASIDGTVKAVSNEFVEIGRQSF